MRSNSTSHQRLRHCAFSREEDENLRLLVCQFGSTDSWTQVAEHMKRRSARQCRERWNVLTLREKSRRAFTPEEDQLLIAKYMEIGPKWNLLQTFFQDRNMASLKNRWKALNQPETTSGPKPTGDIWSHIWLGDSDANAYDLFALENGDEFWDFTGLDTGY